LVLKIVSMLCDKKSPVLLAGEREWWDKVYSSAKSFRNLMDVPVKRR
jgi:hypothetical protein